MFQYGCSITGNASAAAVIQYRFESCPEDAQAPTGSLMDKAATKSCIISRFES